MTRRIVTVGCTWLALASAGCATSGRGVVALLPDGAPEVVAAPADGVYTLARAGRWPTPDEVVVLRTVAAGEAVGFERGANGERVAVAGDFRKPLPGGAYRWLVAPAGHGQPDLGTRLDARFASAGKGYTAAVEPVGKAVAAVVLAPVFLFLYVFHIPLPFS